MATVVVVNEWLSQILGAYWPNAPEGEQVVAGSLNTKPKDVASTTLTEPLECGSSRARS